MRRLNTIVAVAAVGVLCAWALSSARAGDEPAPTAPPKLEKHPLADAKEGEFLRWVQTEGTTKTWYVFRVLGVRQKTDGKTEVRYEVMVTDEAGKKDVAPQDQTAQGSWLAVPDLKPDESKGETFKKDEMVWVDAKGKKIAARHLLIETPVHKGFPQPTWTREVWYSNDVLSTGKWKEVVTTPEGTVTKETLDWGTMTAEELAARKAVYDKPAGDTAPPPADKPPAPPKDGKSCGGPGGCGGGK